MAPSPVFTYDRDGVPVELTGESDWRRAVMRGHVRRDTLVTIFADGAVPTVLAAGRIPELRALFDEAEQETAPTTSRSVEPEPAPAATQPRVDQGDPIFRVAGEWPDERAQDRPTSVDAPKEEPWTDSYQGATPTGTGSLLLLVVIVISAVVIMMIRGCEISRIPVADTPASPDDTAAAIPETAAVAPASYTTSFDCRRAAGQAERTICGDRELALADVELADLYERRMRDAAGERIRDRERAAQRAWIARRDRCADARPCLERVYAERIAAVRAAPAERPRATEKPPKAATPAPAVATEKTIEKTILCVLPEGGEARLPLQQCRLRSGVVMN